MRKKHVAADEDPQLVDTTGLSLHSFRRKPDQVTRPCGKTRRWCPSTYETETSCWSRTLQWRGQDAERGQDISESGNEQGDAQLTDADVPALKLLQIMECQVRTPRRSSLSNVLRESRIASP